jgi:hypothetical protein
MSFPQACFPGCKVEASAKLKAFKSHPKGYGQLRRLSSFLLNLCGGW